MCVRWEGLDGIDRVRCFAVGSWILDLGMDLGYGSWIWILDLDFPDFSSARTPLHRWTAPLDSSACFAAGRRPVCPSAMPALPFFSARWTERRAPSPPVLPLLFWPPFYVERKRKRVKKQKKKAGYFYARPWLGKEGTTRKGRRVRPGEGGLGSGRNATTPPDTNDKRRGRD